MSDNSIHVFQRAVTLHKQGLFLEAQALYNDLLKLNPGNADYQYLLSLSYFDLQNYDDALVWVERSIQTKSNVPVYHNLHGNILRHLHKHTAAIACYEKAISLKPDFVDSLSNLVSLNNDLQKTDEAFRYIEKLQKLGPLSGKNLFEFARIYFVQEDYEKALELLEQAPQEATDFLFLKGRCLYFLKRGKEALALFERIIALDKNYVNAYYFATYLSYYLCESKKGDEYLKVLLEIATDTSTKVWSIFLSHIIPDSTAEMRDHRQKRMNRLVAVTQEFESLETDLEKIGGLLPLTNFYSGYQGFNERNIQMEIARCFYQLYRKNGRFQEKIPLKKIGNGKIKIGFVSSYFYTHSVMNVFQRILVGLYDLQEFEIHIFSTSRRYDEVSEKMKSKSDFFHILTGPLTERSEVIHSKKVDMLVYLDIGMDTVTYFLSYLRLAPIQCVFGGHPVTTGVPNIDYFISGSYNEHAESQECYSEKIVSLESQSAIFPRPRKYDIPRSRKEIGLPEGPLYTCPVNLFKIHPDFDGYIKDILSKDPVAKCIFFEWPDIDWYGNALRRRFAKTLGAQNQQVFFANTLYAEDFVNIMEISDCILDPIHFGLASTGYFAVQSTTPVVTLKPRYLRESGMACLYNIMDIPELIVPSKKAYVDLAVDIAHDPQLQQRLRKLIFEKSHLIYNNNEFVQKFASWIHDTYNAHVQ